MCERLAEGNERTNSTMKFLLSHVNYKNYKEYLGHSGYHVLYCCSVHTHFTTVEKWQLPRSA